VARVTFHNKLPFYGKELFSPLPNPSCTTPCRLSPTVLFFSIFAAASRRSWENVTRIDLREHGMELLTGFVWLRIGISGGLL